MLRSEDARSLDLTGFEISKLPEDPEQIQIHDAREATIGGTRASLTFAEAQLEVILPATYTGGLTVISTDSGDVEIANDWFGGDFKAELLKSGTLTAQSFRDVNTVDLSTDGDGSFEISDLFATTVQVHLRSGSLTAGNVTGHDLSVDADGDGNTTFGQIAIDGHATFEYGSESNNSLKTDDIKAAAVSVQQHGRGDVSFERVQATNEFTVSTNGGSVETASVSTGSMSVSVSGKGDTTFGDIAATGDVTFEYDNESNSELRAGDIKARDISIYQRGEGGVTIGDVQAEDFTVELASGSIETGTVHARNLTVEEEGRGDTTFNNVYVESDVSFTYGSDSNSELKADDVRAKRLTINSRGEGGVTLADFVGDAFLANLYAGSLTAGDLSCRTVAVENEGSGDTTFGTVRAQESASFKFSSESNSTFSTTAIDAGSLDITADGQGDISSERFSGSTGDVAISSESNFNVDTISIASFTFSASGTGDFTVGSLDCRECATIKTDSDSNCNVKIEGDVNTPSFSLDADGEGSVEISGEVVGTNCSLDITACNVELNAARLNGKFESYQRGAGDLKIDTIRAREVECGSTDRGELKVSELYATTASLTNGSEYDMSVESGEVNELHLEVSNSGDVSYSGSASTVSTRKSGSGTIRTEQ